MSPISAPVRVLIVDDSAFIRYTVTTFLEADPDITVVGTARDGQEALTRIPVLKPNVVILDVEMPRMDGLTALKRIMVDCPVPVVMLSALTRQGTRTTIRALMRGAFDFVSKPDTKVDIDSVIEELKSKVKMAAGRSPAQLRPAEAEASKRPLKTGLQPLGPDDPVIIIGTSTGGPRALKQILSSLPANLPAAVVVVQHMPPGFTRSLAQRLNEISPLIVQEAADNDRLARGLALVAPGDFHLRFKGTRRIALDQGPRCHHVRPAVDVTMESAAQTYQARVIGVILTGMGVDGTGGAGQIKAAGGKVIAEHRSTCVIYGMPDSVIRAGWADRIAPLPEITPILMEWVSHERVGV